MNLRFAMMIEKALSIVFLSEMVGCTIIICFLEYGVLLVLARYTYVQKAKCWYPKILYNDIISRNGKITTRSAQSLTSF